MRKLNILWVFLALILMASCTITRKVTPLAPVNVQVNVDMNNLEYIGDVTGTSTQSYVLGIPFGGRKYTAGVAYRGVVAPLEVTPFNPLNPRRGWNNAMYDALMSKADADFVLPIAYDTKTEQMFLGRKVTLTVKAKAFKIKTK